MNYFIIIILIILIIALNLLYPKFRGFMGEFWVKIELKKLPKDNYVVLNNIMLKDKNGTHQIDHIVISKFGIFVIETKNYYGMIIGDEFKDNWIQYLGKNKYYFKNPIHQNYGHIKSLEEKLNIDSNKFISIVCFSNQTTLRVSSKNIVIRLDKLVNTIKNFKNIILNDDIDIIFRNIDELNVMDKFERKEHVINIKEKINSDKEKINNMICPRCSNNLVLRNGKFGNFIGCSNYPRCKFVKK